MFPSHLQKVSPETQFLQTSDQCIIPVLNSHLTTYNISNPNFTWTTNFNFSTLKNEVTALAPGVTELLGYTASLETTNSTVVGSPIGNILAVETRELILQPEEEFLLIKTERGALQS